MKDLARRLRKLEAVQFDATGLVPHSEAWFAYWTDLLGRNMSGEHIEFRGRFPIEVIDRLVQAADREDPQERDRLAAACGI
jgi:hypothetical protein